MQLTTRGFLGDSHGSYNAGKMGGAIDVSQRLPPEVLADCDLDRGRHTATTSLQSSSEALGNPRGNVDELMRMIAQRGKSVNKTRGMATSTSGRKGIVDFFVSAAEQTLTQPSSTPVRRKSAEGVSPTLVDKLWVNVLCKRLDWEKMARQHPLMSHLPVWWQRLAWSARFMSSSALPLTQLQQVSCSGRGCVTDTFVCSAPTGTGKSSLVPLFLLESHWARLLQRMIVTHGTRKDFCADELSQLSQPPLPFPTPCSSCEYVSAFGASSRVCILVSQPTRLACVELAKFTASVMASSSSSTQAVHVGGRVGYAVGSDTCFSPESEIVFATPGYIVNALHHRSRTLSPTTLIIDEVHCRDMETELLLAWVRRQLYNEMLEDHVPLRQLVLMSATLPAEHMSALLTKKAFAVGEPAAGPKGTAAYEAAKGKEIPNPHVLLVDGPAAPSQVADGLSNSRRPLRQFLVEEYFIDDLPDLLEKSHVLQRVTQRSLSTPSSVVCPLLTAPARRVMESLVHFFSYTRFGADIHSPQARALAQFLLFTLQNFAVVSESRTALGSQQHGNGKKMEEQQRECPESILVFLPGFYEMSLVLQSLEFLCRAADAKGEMETPKQSNSNVQKKKNVVSGAEGVVFLQYEHWCFSVALLHATAIGNPQQQLIESARPYPYRIILSTPVAESSVTIQNVRCVVDSCLERRFFADPLTGVTLRSTALTSVSSLQQRSGRTGRTCNGLVFHLAPRRLFVRQLENADAAPRVENDRTPQNSALQLTRHVLSVFLAPAQMQPESITLSTAAVLLRVKHLFPSRSSELLRHMPSTPPLHAIVRGLQQLMDLGLLQSPVTCNDLPFDVEEKSDNAHAVMQSFDSLCLSAKGEFVTYIPIPHEQALLIYHALQFACVEEGILIACAMTVPMLLMAPRVRVQNDDDRNMDTPASQYLQSLEVQRTLASVGTSGSNGVCHLSEPLMLRSLLREWYACTGSNDAVEFFSKYRVNRSALRLVDTSVAQCALRLWHLVSSDSGLRKEDKNVVRELHGEYDTAVLRPSTCVIEQLILEALPPAYRTLLASSLLRLHRCALEHAAYRLSQNFNTMTHWYPHDEQLIRQLQPLPKGGNVDDRREPEWRRPSVPLQLLFGPPQHRLCAAFVAAFARNTMRGEDASHRMHHKRLVRNLGALQGAENCICTFNINLQMHDHQNHQQHAALYERLTPEVLRGVLWPYLSGTHLHQLELFSSGRSAAARFGEAEDKSKENVGQEEHEGVQQKRGELMLAPKVLPFEQMAGVKTTSIALAHIGISLLVSIQSALTRLSVALPPLLSSPQGSGDSETKVSVLNNHDDSATGSRTTTAMAPVHDSTRNYNLRFVEEEEAERGGKTRNMRVMWYDSYGRERFLLLSDLQCMGYEDLFPIPFETGSFPVVRATETGVGSGVEAAPTETEMLGNSVRSLGDDDGMWDGEHMLLSVQRVSFTRAVYWKVALPVLRGGRRRCAPPPSTDEQVSGSGRCYYCWACHSAWLQESGFRAHCRSIAHLNRLALAVQLRIRRDWIAAVSSGTLSDLLLRCRSGGVGVELRHCTLLSSSFLNALQWFPRGDAAPATLPIAIAGSLVANHASEAALARSAGGGLALQALHVWVLDVDQVAARSTATVPPLSLFILAGYLASSSAGFEVALLMNEDHSLTYAVMLYDWGVWRLPVPLPRTQLQSVLDVFAGKPWRGVPADGVDEDSDHDGNGDRDDVCHRDTETGGLHWCVISDICPQCAYCGSSGCGRGAAEPSSGEVVESAILLVLHEYRNSQRTVVSFADYTQRVVAKLNAWSAAQQQKFLHTVAHPSQRTVPKRAAATAAAEFCGGAELLARLVARRQNQPLESLLRDIGCQFLSPPAALLATREEETTSSSIAGHTMSFSPSALAMEGATNEKLFIVPALLPSYLPSPNFAEVLQRHRNAARGVSVKTARSPPSTEEKEGTTSAPSLLPRLQMQRNQKLGQRHPTF